MYLGINLKYDFVVGTVNVLNCHQFVIYKQSYIISHYEIKGPKHDLSPKYSYFFNLSFPGWSIWVFLMLKFDSKVLGCKHVTEFDFLCFVNHA